MDKILWLRIHTIMLIMLVVIWEFTEIGTDVRDVLKMPREKTKSNVGEVIVFIFIFLAVAIAIIWYLFSRILTKFEYASWFTGICSLLFIYIAFKQMVKMIFIPENRAFSSLDIKNFVFAYIVWWIIVSVVNLSQPGVELPPRNEIVKVFVLFAWLYINFLFTLGSVYILLYYVWILGKKLGKKLDFVWTKIKNLIKAIYDSWQGGRKYTGLKSFKVWQKNKKNIAYKLFMTFPLFVFDIVSVSFLFIKIATEMILIIVIAAIIDPIYELCKLVKIVWNKHKNNEWMYVLAQIAGLCSYIVVFLMIQYGGYEDETKKVYEFVGTIILIPYFLSKIMKLKKNKNEVVREEEGEQRKVESIVIPEKMSYNEDGEGIINGKTIRQLEFEAMQRSVNNPESLRWKDSKAFLKELHRMRRKKCRKKILEFIENNIEVLVGIFISLCFLGVYFLFRNANSGQNVDLIGSIIGAEGALIAVLITIVFTKNSNKKALGASVLPYITIERELTPAENAFAFEYVQDRYETSIFSFWRPFDFESIRDDKRKLVRNGIAYLHIKNIGIGPAIHLKMNIDNFSNVFLPIDYLRPDDEINLILNFNNPNQSDESDIIIEYETIRGDKHSQRFHANITWHLDRTNFTLFR